MNDDLLITSIVDALTAMTTPTFARVSRRYRQPTEFGGDSGSFPLAVVFLAPESGGIEPHAFPAVQQHTCNVVVQLTQVVPVAGDLDQFEDEQLAVAAVSAANRTLADAVDAAIQADPTRGGYALDTMPSEYKSIEADPLSSGEGGLLATCQLKFTMTYRVHR